MFTPYWQYLSLSFFFLLRHPSLGCVCRTFWIIHHLPICCHRNYCAHPTMCFSLMNYLRIWLLPFLSLSVLCLHHFLLWCFRDSTIILAQSSLLARFHLQRYYPLWLLFFSDLQFLALVYMYLFSFIWLHEPVPPFIIWRDWLYWS